LVSDGLGGAIVAWKDSRAGQYDIYAQHVLASGALHAAWPSTGRALCTSSGDQLTPQIATNDAGGAIIGWEDDRHGSSNTDIYAMGVMSSGQLAAVMTGRVDPLRVGSASPNPMHAAASIAFDLPSAQSVSVTLYDVSGHVVRTMAARQQFPAGNQRLTWDGMTDNGSPANPGIYFVRVLAAGASVSRTVTLLR